VAPRREFSGPTWLTGGPPAEDVLRGWDADDALRPTGMTPRCWLAAALLAAADVVGLAGPASASRAGSPSPSSYTFTCVVMKTTNGGRVAAVRTDDGRAVTMVGTPDEGSAATSVDRRYVVGTRQEFHPLDSESPYQGQRRQGDAGDRRSRGFNGGRGGCRLRSAVPPMAPRGRRQRHKAVMVFAAFTFLNKRW